jgi:CRP-like cAMP-binding protein
MLPAMGNHWFRRFAGNGQLTRRGRREHGGGQLGTVLDLGAGQVLCREGALASQWFLLLHGAIAVTSGGRPAGTVTPGQWFGPNCPDDDQALLAATATAITDARVLVFDREEYRALAWMHPHGDVRIVADVASDLAQ